VKITTAVVREEAQPFSLEKLEEPRVDEVLVRNVVRSFARTYISCGGIIGSRRPTMEE
jgi:Zn-dependent alcohol dehydrogenase